MTMSIVRIPGEPILVMAATGHFTLNDAREMFLETGRFKDETKSHVYRISDFSMADSTFGEVVSILRLASTGMSGSTADPDVTVVMVGDNKWAKMAAELLKQPQFHGLNIPIFHTQHEALDYARMHIALAKGDEPK